MAYTVSEDEYQTPSAEEEARIDELIRYIRKRYRTDRKKSGKKKNIKKK